MAGPAPPAPTRPPRAAAAALRVRGLPPPLANGALLCFVCAMWASCATNAATIAASWAYGEDSRAAAAAKKASFAALVAVGVFVWLALPPMFSTVEAIVAKARRERRRAERAGAPLRWVGAGIPVSVLIATVLALFVLLGWLIEGLTGKGSGLHRAGSALNDIASFLACILLCLVILPSFIIQPRFFTAVKVHT